MAKPNLWALSALMLVVIQVKGLAHVHAYSPSHSHSRGPGITPKSSIYRRVYDQRARAASRGMQFGANFFGSVSRQSYPERSRTPPAETVEHGRAAMSFSMHNARRSRQEKDALMSFKANISNSGTTFRNWDANDSSPCRWTGVSCSHEQHVLALSLPSRSLEGSINSALVPLSKLHSLRKLDLSDNNFTSSISGLSLLNFSRLAFLNLSYNQVSGDIPREIGELSRLQWLMLEGNSLSGSIPPSITNCTILKTLNLESNFFVSHIPEGIGRLGELEELILGTHIPENIFYFDPPKNQIFGPLPNSLGNCSSLSALQIRNCPMLQGHIPQELSQLYKLQWLTLIFCNLKGTVPQWIGNLTSLIGIELMYNQLHGSISAELAKPPELTALSLGSNFLVGSIPPEIGNCTKLTVLDLGSNLMSGIIPSGLRGCRLLEFLSFAYNPLMNPQLFPSWITSLTELQALGLNTINLHGKIPMDIGRLSKLEMLIVYENWLTGPIPSSLWNCTLLFALELDGNNLTGQISSDIGFLSNLQWLEMWDNVFTGLIPSSITNLTKLLYCDFAHNALGGTIDVQWGQLSQLMFIHFEHNQLVGSIPKSLSYCSNLFDIHMNSNQLTGEIPAVFGNMSHLEVLDIGYNRISGNIPASLGNCSFLGDLRLSGNKLEGPFQDFGNLPLIHLYMNDNQFTGTILSSLSNLTNLFELDLSQNCFSGRVPGVALSKLTELTSINLSHNLFSGSLFADWGKLVVIQKIDVSSNNISGPIPNFSKMMALQSLDLSLNNFSGELPQWLASLPLLEFFNASYNNFGGPIPSSRAFNSNFTEASFLGNPGLCGGVLDAVRVCPPNVSKTHVHGHCKGIGCAGVWIPTTVAGIIFLSLAAAAAVVMWWLKSNFVKKVAGGRKDVIHIFVKNPNQSLVAFSPSDILAVIRKESNKIGSGSRSVVYKGSLPGLGLVAIKTFVGYDNNGLHSKSSNMWQHVLEKEAKIHSSLRHRNILKILCFCFNVDFQALVLEYIPRGSLENHLHPIGSLAEPGLEIESDAAGANSSQGCELPWEARFDIAIDIAEGMKYLHHEHQEPLIHGDLKPSNILLNNDMVAKVADFGISKSVNLHQGGELEEATASSICGTTGYMPPEYAFAMTISMKGDVFSYGILLLEMLSRRAPSNVPCSMNYREWNLHCFHDNPLELLDQALQQECLESALKKKQILLLAKVAFLCTQENPQTRPSMKDIRLMLTQIQELDSEEVPRKTVSELLTVADENISGSNGINAWQNDDPNAIALASISL